MYASNVPLRATLKTVAFLSASFAAVFSTHSGLTIVFFVLAGLGAHLAKKCFW